MARVARISSGAVPEAEKPENIPNVNTSYYDGSPSPYDLDQAIAEKGEDEDFGAKARYLRENFGVASPELLLLVIDKLEVVDVEEETDQSDAPQSKPGDQPPAPPGPPPVTP